MSRRSLTLGIVVLATIAGWWVILRGDGSISIPGVRTPGEAAIPTAPPTGLGAAGPAETKPTGEEPPAPRPEDVPTLRGVVKGANGSPLGGAAIHVVGDGPGTAVVLSREDGTFELPSRPERAAVWVHAPGQVMPSEDLGWISRKETKEVRLAEGVPLHVLVLDASGGAPVAGAVVRSFAGSAPGAATRGRPSDEAITGGDGRATVRVPRGRAFVVAQARGLAPGRSSPVDVESAGATVRVELAVGAALEGRVVSESGAPVADASLHCVVGDLYDRREVTNKEGGFRFEGVPTSPAAGGMTVRAMGFGPAALDLAPLDPGATQAVELRLSTARFLDVSCLARDGSPAAGIFVQARPADATWQRIEREEPAPAGGRTGPDGHVRLGPVAVGAAVVEADDMWSRGAEPQPVDVAGDSQLVSVVIRQSSWLSPRYEVRVLDPEGKPLRAARVMLGLDRGEPPWTPLFVPVGDEFETDALGVAAVPRTPNTPTILCVLAKGYVRMDRLLRPQEQEGPRIEMRLSKAAARLRFLDRAGAPATLGVALESVGNGRDSPWRRRSRPVNYGEDQETDEAGRVTFRGLGEGAYALRLTTYDFVIVSGPPTIRAGPDEILLTVVPADQAPTRIRTPLLLRDAATGQPIVDAQVVVIETDEEFRGGSRDDEPYTAPDVPPGAYDLAIFATGFLPTVVARVPLNGSQDPVVVPVSLDRGATIAGTVRDEAGHAVAGLSVGVSGDEGAGAETGEDGTFRIPGLQAGSRSVVVTSPRLTKSVERLVRVDPAFVTQLDVVVALAGALRVQLDGDPSGNTVRLELRDAAGVVKDAASTGYHRSPAGWRPHVSEIHTFEALAPGAYWLVITWNGETEPWIPVSATVGQETVVTIAPP